ncbi:MAG: hypothetical protein Q7S59_06930 [Sulfurimonas sp.]|nr:hypothetical protein [Sulfurimonas sp.]
MYKKAGIFLIGIIILVVLDSTGIARKIMTKQTTQADIEKMELNKQLMIANDAHVKLAFKIINCEPFNKEDEEKVLKFKYDEIWQKSNQIMSVQRDTDIKKIDIFSYDSSKCTPLPPKHELHVFKPIASNN